MAEVRLEPDYWFLYEGTPGGTWQPEASSCQRPDHSPSDLLTARWETLFARGCVTFTGPNGPRSLARAAELPEPARHSYYPMAPMTVFGFGRKLDSLDKGIRQPARFAVALGEDSAEAELRANALIDLRPSGS